MTDSIGGRFETRPQAPHAGYDDDAATFAVYHARQNSLGTKVRSAQIHLEAVPPCVAISLPSPAKRPQDTCVSDHQVYRTELLLDSGHHLPDSYLIGHIDNVGAGTAAGCLYHRDRLLHLIGRPRDHGNRGARVGEYLRRCAPDAPATAGDDGDLSSQCPSVFIISRTGGRYGLQKFADLIANWMRPPLLCFGMPTPTKPATADWGAVGLMTVVLELMF